MIKWIFSFHYFYKPKHLVGAFVVMRFVVFRLVVERLVGIDVKFVEELHYMKSAFIDVEMYVSFLKIRRAGLPDLCFGVQRLYRLPRGETYSLAVRFGRHEKQFKVIVVAFLVYFENCAADRLTVFDNSIGFVVRLVDATLNSFARDDLAVVVDVIIALAELLHRAVLERPLVVKYKLFPVRRFQWFKNNFAHNALLKIKNTR